MTGVLTLALSACTPETVSPAALTDASQIYANDCASCHAPDRTGDHGKDITPGKLTDFTTNDLTAFVTDHKTGKNLTAEQIAILADWLKTTP
ncbi:MAG: c-type cytochrome [Dehalogenimonas sp.]